MQPALTQNLDRSADCAVLATPRRLRLLQLIPKKQGEFINPAHVGINKCAHCFNRTPTQLFLLEGDLAEPPVSSSWPSPGWPCRRYSPTLDKFSGCVLRTTWLVRIGWSSSTLNQRVQGSKSLCAHHIKSLKLCMGFVLTIRLRLWMFSERFQRGS